MRPPRLTIKTVAISLTLATAAEFLLAIWTGDVRWAQTAVVFAVPGLLTCIGWLGTMFEGDDEPDPPQFPNL